MAGRLGSTGTGVTGLGIAVGEFLPLSARRHPDRACFRFPDGSAHSFALTNARVNRLASALRAEGVRRGDRLAVFALDSHRYMEIVLACRKLGAATEAGLQTTLTPEDHRWALAERPELLHSCGRPSIGVALRIVDADLRDVPRGEVVRAFVTAATGHRPAAEELLAHCRARLASHKVPREFVVLDAMPVNASGKILKRELRRWTPSSAST
ncbi:MULTISPECIES: AMP-binding protein [Actinomadura]|nr:AMP-binding protein [Actinomadura geliboluensis]